MIKRKGYMPVKQRETYLKRKYKKEMIKGTTKGRKRRKRGNLTKLKLKLWELCKQIVRARCIKKHGKLVCYTSGKVLIHPKDAHTGHYIHSSMCSVELRYDLKNLQIQSYDENINKNGNTLQFRENLIKDYGLDYVEELWQRNKETKGKVYKEDWFISKIAEYTALLKDISTT